MPTDPAAPPTPHPNTPKNPRGKVHASVRNRRRELVEQLWVKGYAMTEITNAVNERLAETWDVTTVTRDVKYIRAQWEKEGAHRSPANRKAELERMCREVFKSALQTKKAVHERVIKDGKACILTRMVPAPDLMAANRAIERMGALHGLNVTTLDGTMSVQGLADLVGDLGDLGDLGDDDAS